MHMGYAESMDVVAGVNFFYEHVNAINNSELKSNNFNEDMMEIDKNLMLRCNYC